ncbi:hypothetical protein EV659_10529 [Rhodothalassium salexigens DSM 2132]|uniref:Uncharacterized protein n=1 Tax=Rhodothalassium salexigens DSM 2132 TaxID=1188247 RepID=A0A4R2PI98_RHOSA|nr:hypothetical protein [Rhodothalassium salexigens]MBB4211664.1 hypothetical protein [Rhodothalassium salexigens DSM 2132]MBK1639301.1 hypothetical protein [Rhodothalassium salexigens DSM 2132]TCP34404.1 hypothetical protein EV659_10529 [Rhodothalassium salexigens DSM 2132]
MPRSKPRPPLPPRASAAWRPSQRQPARGRKPGQPLRRLVITLGALALLLVAWRAHRRYVGASPYELGQFALGVGVFIAIAIAGAALAVIVWKLGARLFRRPGHSILDRVEDRVEDRLGGRVADRAGDGEDGAGHG